MMECPYCDNQPKLVTGRVIYPHRTDLYKLWFYLCKCGARVGCHPGTKKPLGRLADAELRQAKSKAHLAFDPIWRDRLMRRKQAYKWLSNQLNIDFNDCHIGMFDVETCNRVVDICSTPPDSEKALPQTDRIRETKEGGEDE